MRIFSLTTLECTKLLAASRLGHLACTKDGRPYVVPIYFAYSDNHLYAFSMPGKKIDWMRANPQVSIFVHRRGRGSEWKSVVVDGRYEELPDRIGHKRERDRAWSLSAGMRTGGNRAPSSRSRRPCPAVPEHVFFRILVEEISGRQAKEGM